MIGLLLPAKIHAQFYDHSYAIVIGIDQYEHGDLYHPLSYAVKDAQAVANLFSAQGFTVIPLYGPKATKTAILSAMEDTLAPKLGAGDRVLVFFAGHGKAESLGGKERGYIVPYDGQNRSSLISMEDLEDQSSYMGNAKHQLFILDSCYGGLLAEPRDSLVDLNEPDYLNDITSRIAREVLTAGGSDQEVLDSGPDGHSVFVDALLEALRDGRADTNGRGYITFSELVAYVTPRASNRYQTPLPGILPGNRGGQFLFTNPKGPGRPVAAIPVPASPTRRGDDSPMTAKQYIALGDARWNVSDWDGAAAQYRAAIRVDPNNAEAHVDLGVALDRKGDWDGDIKEQREAIRLKPDFAEAHSNLGVALDNKGDWDGAIKEEREAIRLKPDFAEAHSDLGIALENKGDWDGGMPPARPPGHAGQGPQREPRDRGSPAAQVGDLVRQRAVRLVADSRNNRHREGGNGPAQVLVAPRQEGGGVPAAPGQHDYV